MQFLTISVDTCGESTGRGHGDWHGERVRDKGTEQGHEIRARDMSMHGANGQGKDKYRGQEQGTGARDKGMGQGYGTRARDKGTIKGNG